MGSEQRSDTYRFMAIALAGDYGRSSAFGVSNDQTETGTGLEEVETRRQEVYLLSLSPRL